MPARNDERLYRLVGEPGVDDDHEHGGGVEVVTLFTMILEAALDDGGVTVEGITPAVQEHYAYKNRRLTTLYQNAIPYPMFTRDGIDQLAEVGLLREAGPGRWSLGEDKFAAGKMLAAVPGRDRRSVSVVVYPRDVRELRTELDTARLTTNECEAMLRVGGPGLRPVDHEHVARLARSMELEGYLAHHPVLVDKPPKKGDPYRWIIDGRHRLAAAKIANVKAIYREVEVKSATEVVSLARAANLAVGWSRNDWRRLLSHMSGPERDHQVREWIRWELEVDPGRSDQKVADVVKCDRSTVTRVRNKTPDASMSASERRHQRLQEAITKELGDDPDRTDREIADAVGCHHTTVMRARNARSSGAVGAALHEAHQTITEPEPEDRPEQVEPAGKSDPELEPELTAPTSQPGPGPDKPGEQVEPGETLDGQPAERQPTPKTCAIVLANVNDPVYLANRMRDILNQHATVPLRPLMKAVAAELDQYADQITRVV